MCPDDLFDEPETKPLYFSAGKASRFASLLLWPVSLSSEKVAES